MAALRLQFKKHLCEPLKRDFVFALLAERLTDLIVLAIDAAQVAKPEKDITRAALSNKRGLFAKVRRVGRNYRQQPRITGGDFIIQTIHVTIARAYAANAKHFH